MAGGVSDTSPQLQPSTISALDQFGALCTQIADIAVAHHRTLKDGGVPAKLAGRLTEGLHSGLVEMFLPTDDGDEE
jgi:hypothetical protein